MAMGITLVMRGDDHISNTPKQIMLYDALGVSLPRFGHLPMIHGTDGKKLSKRHGATAVGDYQHMGILPETMLNFLALLGWSPGNDVEVMSLSDMIREFSVEGLSKKAAIFDPKKLEWMNGQHLARADSERLLPLVAQGLIDAGLTTPAAVEARRPWYIELIDLMKVRGRTIDEIVQQCQPYVREQIQYDAAAVGKQWKDRGATTSLLSATRDRLSAVPDWSAAELERALRELAELRGLSAGKLFQPLRVALTGTATSPGIFEVLMILGRDRSMARIDSALRHLDGDTGA
jgi:glutamyl-tRNA synthetase